MFGAEGKDGVIPTLGDGWCNPNLGTRGASVGCDFHSTETSVWMFCRLGKAVKNYMVISYDIPPLSRDGQY
jgi:hypothetical protein